MSHAHSSQSEKQPSKKADQVRDMAARLFAELFYKQVLAEREQKRRHKSDKEFDSKPQMGLQ